jgi:hypothetical protein
MRRLARIAAAAVALGLLLAGCASSPPPELVRRTVRPPVTSDLANPCTKAAAGATGGSGRVRGEPIRRCHRGTGSRDQHDSNPAGTGITLERLSKAIGNSAALRELQPGEWMVGANIEIDKCASLTLSARPM